jgi:hypothetical protein
MIIEEEDWRMPIIKYLQKDELPSSKDEAYKLKKTGSWYSMLGDKLYKRGFSGPLLLCVSKEEVDRILEEVQEGSCGSHIGAKRRVDHLKRHSRLHSSSFYFFFHFKMMY